MQCVDSPQFCGYCQVEYTPLVKRGFSVKIQQSFLRGIGIIGKLLSWHESVRSAEKVEVSEIASKREEKQNISAESERK